jgi:hypothetical protein
VEIPALKPVFESGPNKDFLRGGYDKTLVEQWRSFCGRPLKYLGLPAWELLDIIEWQEFLSRFTTIEREENQQHLMFLRANVKDLEHRLCCLYGNFDEILLKGRDKYDKLPDWPYDLMNLDYFGGFIYQNLSRPKALKKLIQNQSTYERSFMLIITQQLRDGDIAGEKLKFLDDLAKCLKGGVIGRSLHPAIDKVVDWYRRADIPDAARQALYMNFFLRDCGESEHFDVKCRPAIVYPGSGGAWMIHFVTDFSYCGGVAHRVVSEQTMVKLINLGLLEVKDGKFAETRFVQPSLSV